MKKLKTLTTVALILCILVFLLTITDFMALHDIRNDYVSKKVITSVSDNLPTWTNTPGEWRMVTISFISRFFFFIFNIVVLLFVMWNFGQQKQKQADSATY